jgi:sugar-specific transcriptional regulator TrmB
MGRKAVNDEPIETLMRLGLTFCQARIYLALVELGESPVRPISKNSGVARAEVYRTMPTLLTLGLVKKVLDIPIRFKATPLQDGLNLLLKQKNSEHQELHKKVTKLVDNIKENSKRTMPEIEKQFVVIPGKDSHIQWLKNQIKKSQTCSDSIVTWNDYKIVNFFCEKEAQKSANRGVTDRMVIYLSENEKTVDKNDESFKNIRPNTQRRIVFTPPLALGAVFDKKEVIIATTLNNPIQTGEPVFWSNNFSVIALFQNYFETLWEKALEQRHHNRNL